MVAVSAHLGAVRRLFYVVPDSSWDQVAQARKDVDSTRDAFVQIIRENFTLRPLE